MMAKSLQVFLLLLVVERMHGEYAKHLSREHMGRKA